MRRRIFIVDDHPLIRRGYAFLLGREPDFEVCGETSTPTEALEMIPRIRPDLVITDISLEGANGIEFIKSLHYGYPTIPVLVVSMHDENLYAERALRAGARGYVTKRRTEATIVSAIRKILEGGFYFSDHISQRIMAQYQELGSVQPGSPVDLLTDRELEVFELLGQGLTLRQIGEALHISPKTVETHRLGIKTKLGVETSAELTRRAVEWVHMRDN